MYLVDCPTQLTFMILRLSVSWQIQNDKYEKTEQGNQWVQTQTSPCFSISELIMQSSGMLGSICCCNKEYVELLSLIFKDHLDCHHSPLLVLVILGLVLRQARFWPTNFSTNIARPGNPFDVGFRVAFEVGLQQSCHTSKMDQTTNLLWEKILLWFLHLRQFSRRQCRSRHSHSCQSLTLRWTGV